MRYTHMMEYYSAIKRNKSELSCSAGTSSLLIQSEVSQEEKNSWYLHTYTWNLEKQYRWTYSQGRNGDADMENGPVGTVGEGEGGMNWGSCTDRYTLSGVKQVTSRKLLHNPGSPAWCQWWPRGAGWKGRGRRQRKGIYIYMILYIYTKYTHICCYCC